MKKIVPKKEVVKAKVNLLARVVDLEALTINKDLTALINQLRAIWL